MSIDTTTTPEKLSPWYDAPPPSRWVSPDVLALKIKDGEGVDNTCRFLPWVGERYAEGISLLGHPPSRLLLVGESHYEAVDHCAFTWDVVMRQWGQGALAMSRSFQEFFPTVERLIGGPGDRAQPLALEEFYQRLAFYNYVREPMPNGSTRPTSSDFKAAWPAFRRVLTTLQPNIVLFFGMDMWDTIPGPEEQVFDLKELGFLAKCDTRDLKLWRIDSVASRPLVFPVHHPSYLRRDPSREACSMNWIAAGLRAVHSQFQP